MSKEKVTKNRIAPRQKTQDGDKHWNFKAPSYDNRTSCSVSAGDNYGVGFKQPVGKFSASSMKTGPISLDTFQWDPSEYIKQKDTAG